MNKFAIMLLALTAISAPALANDSRDVRDSQNYSGPYAQRGLDNLDVKITDSMIRKHKGLSEAVLKEISRLDEKNGSTISVAQF